jgi:hypothetical protein
MIFSILQVFFTLILSKFQSSRAAALQGYENYCFEFHPNHHASFNYTLCNNFEDFALLQAKNKTTRAKPETIVELFAGKPLILSKDLEIFELAVALFDEKNLKSPLVRKWFRLRNLKGIDMNFFQSRIFNGSYFPNLIIQNAKFDFYLNGKNLMNEKCEQNLVTTQFYDALINILTLSSIIRYEHAVCPYIFDRFFINFLHVDGLSNHFIKRNLLKFCTVKEDMSQMLNSSISSLSLSGYNHKLDESLLNPLVFSRIEILTISGRLNVIQSDVFKSFKQLIIVEFRIEDFQYFFYKLGVEWLQSLRPEFDFKNKEQKKYALYLNFNQYKSDPFFIEQVLPFGDQDSCLYADFPHNRLVYPILNIDLNKTTTNDCTCTIFWLVHGTDMYYKDLKFIDRSLAEHSVKLYNSCVMKGKKFISDCIDYFYKQKHCVIKPSSSQQSMKMTAIDRLYQLNEMKYFLIIILKPFVCLGGFLLNIFIAYIQLKYRKTLKEKFYKYMCLNSVFNSIYCFIHILDLINECIEDQNGVFCSSIYTTFFAQYFKKIAESFFAESIKLASNMTYILMSINRLMLIGREQVMLFERIAKLNFKSTLKFILLISFSLSFVKYFKYDVNIAVENLEYPFLMRSYDLKDKFVTVLILFYDFLNYFLFTLMNSFIECMIILKLNHALADKEKMRCSLRNGPRKSYFVFNNRMITKRLAAKLSSHYVNKERSAILMVVLNSALNILLRMPEICLLIYYTYFYFIQHDKLFIKLCIHLTFCVLVIDLADFLFLFTFVLNFFIYFMFNKNFRQCVMMTAESKLSRNEKYQVRKRNNHRKIEASHIVTLKSNESDRFG